MDKDNHVDFNEQSAVDHAELSQPKAKGNPSKKSRGGFQEFLAMSLSKEVFDGIKYADYKRPTPIQRAAIPVIRSGQDVVAMARTGSGKTASFLIPMFEILKRHNSIQSPRALILEPTRELATQTLRFAKNLGRFTGLHCALVVGGDHMDSQFDALHQHPDILIATPGRLMHICVEMKLSLNHVQYVVFDEADRLFELGFRDQLEEILARLSVTRQTLLFSATLPKMIAEFAKAGLSNPSLIRLDKDEKLSEQLQLAFFSITPEYKLHLLVYIASKVLKKSEQMIVFASTQVEVQFLQNVFEKLDIKCTFLYSEMDPSSRKINAAQFQKKVVNILIATDIAARGIDIPNLDYVLNYNFPGTAKTFVHRVGRAARAGKCGVAISFVSTEEEPYLWDLHKFLGRSVKFSPAFNDTNKSQGIELVMDPGDPLLGKESQEKKDNDFNNWSYQFGTVPSEIYEEENSQIKRLLHDDDEIHYLIEKKDKAYKLYVKSRPKASKEALREMREMKQIITPGIHPFLLESVKRNITKCGSEDSVLMMQRRQLLMDKLRSARPSKTIFELGIKGTRSASRSMQQKRKKDDLYIAKCQEKLKEKKAKYQSVLKLKAKECSLPQMTEDDIFYEFPSSTIVEDEMQATVNAKRKKMIEEEEKLERKRQKVNNKLEEKFGTDAEKKTQNNKKRDDKFVENVKQGFFIPYQPANLHTEKGYSINSNFAKDSKEAALDLMQDEYSGITRQKLINKKWDTKKNKFLGKRLQEKKIKTESGRVIRASYKSDRYEAWMKRNRIDQNTLEGAAADTVLIAADEQHLKEEDGKFKVLNTKKMNKVHPLMVEHNKKLGHRIVEEVRNPDQLTKHRKWQKRFEADRERGQYLKKMKAIMLKKDNISKKAKSSYS